jgi:cation diffusion facilitator family transporter
MAGSKGVVLAAMIANGAIAILKFFGFLLTGSPSMLAETYHSISDTGNQVLLLIGIRYSTREATEAHPFGHGKAQFFYAFLVSVLLFGVAGWESLKHGWHEVQAGGHETETGAAEFLGFTIDIQTPVDPFWITVVILLGAICFETWAFHKANTELKRQMRKYDWSSYREAFDRTSDVTTLTAFVEDTVALLGLIVALGGIVTSRITGNPIFDAFGAVLIGILLMFFAVALAWENKRLILGESLPDEVETELREAVEAETGVDSVVTLRTMFVGAGKVLVTADVRFDADLSTAQFDETIDAIEELLQEKESRVSVTYIEPER